MNRLLAEYASAEQLRAAVVALQVHGLTLETYSPEPLDTASADPPTRCQGLSMAAALGASLGAVYGYGIQFFSATVDYPLNVGGRPLHSAIAFVPATLELGILGAALALLAMFAYRAQLPRFHRPIFAVRGFERACIDRYFLQVDLLPTRAKVDVREQLQRTHPVRIEEMDDAA
jgi:hypothetical protein